MRIFQKVWLKILILISTGTLSLISLGVINLGASGFKKISITILLVSASLGLGIWSIIWENLWGEKRKFRRDRLFI